MNKIFENKKAIIFDMDGVLLDTEEYHRAAWNKTFATKDVFLSKDEYYRCCQSVGRRKAILNAIPDASDELILELSQIKEKHFVDEINEKSIELYDDAVVFLNTVNESELSLAIGTSSSMGREVIGRTNYKHYFDKIVTGRDIEKNKPNPEIFIKACSQLELKPSETVVIEDSLVGVIAAVLGGMDVIGVNRNDSLKDVDLNEITNYIKDYGFNIKHNENDDIKQLNKIIVNSLSELI